MKRKNSGISTGIVDKIFEPYFTTKKKGKGTGLGMAVVYGIIQKHTGTITVESAPGKGASFSVYLPLIDRELDQPIEETNAPGKTGKQSFWSTMKRRWSSS